MQIKNLTLSFGVQKIFDNVNLIIPENEKVGIVGVNGAGKTTFLKVILKKLEPDFGYVKIKKDLRIGFLPQVIDEEIMDNNETVFDFLLNARPIENLNNKLQNLYEKVALNPSSLEQEKLFREVEKTQKKLEYWGFYSYSTELLKIIKGMDISDDILYQEVKKLSGGQKSKVAFARLLYSKPEIILLDEPTNHLDKITRDFVIDYLKKYKGSIYVISHDIDFLNNITTKTLYLDKQNYKMELYDGNYNKFIKVYEAKQQSLENEIKKQNKEIEKLQAIVDKYKFSSGKRKKMAQDREKKLAKMKSEQIDYEPKIKNVKIKMLMNRESGNLPLKVENLCFKYDKKNTNNIINNLSFSLSKREKFLIVGPNGIGKSTLLKLIVGKLKQDSGQIIIGNKTDIGYYAQEHELLDNDKSIIDNFDDIAISPNQLRNCLGRFLFYKDDVFKRVGILSPGEKSRVALAKLSLIGANFLILDEPTNHLDPKTQQIIAETFKEFQGTMLVVSHNPDFTNNLGIERTLILPEGKLDYYHEEIVDYYQKLNNEKKKKKR